MESVWKPSVNNFQTDLTFSLNLNEEEEINNAYKRAFPHLVSVEIVQDINLQKRGIDKVLHFEAGNKSFVDEKKRRVDYRDILLEEYSDFDKKRVGWLGKDKYTDYISYVIFPTKKLFLFPFLLLQRAWLQNYKSWLEKYGRKFAQNEGYRTSNIPVPIAILLERLTGAQEMSL